MTMDPVEKSDEFDRQNDVGTALQGLRNLGATHQRIIRILAFSVAFEAFLSVGFGIVAWEAKSGSAQAQQASTQARINCLAGNESRRVQADLWNYVLTLPPSTKESPAAKRLREQNVVKFKAYIAKAFAPRDCSSAALSRPKPAPSSVPTLSPTPPAQQNHASAASAGPQPQPAPQTTVVVVEPRSTQSSQPSSSHPSRPPPSRTSSPSASPSSTPGVICRLTHICIKERPWRLLQSALNGSTRIATADVITLTRNTSLASAYVEASAPTATSLPPTSSWLLRRVTSALSSSSVTPVGSAPTQGTTQESKR